MSDLDDILAVMGDLWRQAKEHGTTTAILEGVTGMPSSSIIAELARESAHASPPALSAADLAAAGSHLSDLADGIYARNIAARRREQLESAIARLRVTQPWMEVMADRLWGHPGGPPTRERCWHWSGTTRGEVLPPHIEASLPFYIGPSVSSVSLYPPSSGSLHAHLVGFPLGKYMSILATPDSVEAEYRAYMTEPSLEDTRATTRRGLTRTIAHRAWRGWTSMMAPP